ncbi:MAG: hypothetical protein IPK68_09330 [Bdellovibrionales bacterium]|nr:hypothetical protein [Bdellovibrionales bacterium]
MAEQNFDQAVYEVKNAFIQQNSKVIAFGSYGASDSVLHFLNLLLLELAKDLDYVGTAISSEEQSSLDAFIDGSAACFDIEPAMQYWFPIFRQIKVINTNRFAIGRAPIRVLALGLDSSKMTTAQWMQECGQFLYENLKMLTDDFEGRGLVVTTPHYLAKESSVPMTLLARRYIRAPEMIPTAGYLIRSHPLVANRVLHLWVEKRLSGLDFFAGHMPERYPIEKLPVPLSQKSGDEQRVVWSTQDPEYVAAERALISEQHFLPSPIYKSTEQFDYMISFPDEPVAHSSLCMGILSRAFKVSKGIVLRALSAPYIGF